MMQITERQFLLTVTLVFPVPFIVPRREELFLTKLSVVVHYINLLWGYLLLVCSMLMKKKQIKREEYITGLLEVTVTEGFLMEGYSGRETFVFEMVVLSSTRSPTTVHIWVVTALQLILLLLFVIAEIFSLVVILIYSHILCCICLFLKIMTVQARIFLQLFLPYL